MPVIIEPQPFPRVTFRKHIPVVENLRRDKITGRLLVITPMCLLRQVKPGQKIKSEVQLATEDFILVLLKGHAAGQFAYLPAKRVCVLRVCMLRNVERMTKWNSKVK